jgi:amino acid transporter
VRERRRAPGRRRTPVQDQLAPAGSQPAVPLKGIGVNGLGPPPAARLEPDAIGVAQDTVIGMASAAPAVSVGLTLAALASAAAYGGGPVIIVTAIPMLVIANAYRRLNMWNANCGASFEWVGRSISPLLGFLTGWLMIAAYVTGAVSGVEVLGPSVLAVAGASTAGTGADIAIATAVTLIMLVIAVVGIRITARTQVTMAVAEYAILIGFAVAGLLAVLHHHPGTFGVSVGWLSPTGIGGRGSITAGLVAAVYIFSGWDGTVYVNEEVKHRRTNPGRAAIVAVALLTVIYTLAQVGLQGVVRPARLQAHANSALVYVAGTLGGPGWAKVMALALALSVIAATGTSIVLTARIIYGMASYRALPQFLASVSRRFATPVPASILTGALVIGITWVYLLATSVQNAFNDVVDESGQLFAVFYILTAMATVVYYRRRVLASARDALSLGILPVGAAAFLGWILARYLQSAPAPQIWSLAGIVASGLLMMAAARFLLRSPFFALSRESDDGS